MTKGGVVRVLVRPGSPLSWEPLPEPPTAFATAEHSVALSSALARQTVPDDISRSALRCVTSIAAALADVFGECAVLVGGERIEVWRDAGGVTRTRSYPVDAADDAGTLRWRDQEIPIQYAAAFAAAMCDPERVPNQAHLLPGAAKARWTRLREPALNLAAAAALLLAGLGVWSHREMRREEADLEAARQATMEVWSRVFPTELPKDKGLPAAMLRRLRQAGDPGAAGPSALAFWAELGAHMPDPDPLGISVESLDLSPEGGRLSARLPAAKEDALKNASVLEGQLGQSERLRTRGDYEVRDGQVHVRLRMEFKQ